MKLKSVEIENFRAIDELRLPLHPTLTVLHGDNAHGKTSVLSAIAVGLASIRRSCPGSRVSVSARLIGVTARISCGWG